MFLSRRFSSINHIPKFLRVQISGQSYDGLKLHSSSSLILSNGSQIPFQLSDIIFQSPLTVKEIKEPSTHLSDFLDKSKLISSQYRLMFHQIYPKFQNHDSFTITEALKIVVGNSAIDPSLEFRYSKNLIGFIC